MNKAKHTQGGSALIIGIIALVVIVGGVLIFAGNKSDTLENDPAMTSEETNTDGGAMVEEGNAMMVEGAEGTDMVVEEGSAMMVEGAEGSDMVVEDDGAMMASEGSYEAYSPEKLAWAEDMDVVLFFHATWCPTCRAADKSITETGVPDGLTILKLDYDKETALRKKYGVTTQHTFVQVDAQGNMKKKWTGSITVEAIQKQLI